MSRPVIPSLFLLFVSILISGSLGLKSVEECGQLEGAPEKIECYHLAAVTMAYLQGPVSQQPVQGATVPAGQDAQSICGEILSVFNTGASAPDIRQRANMEANDCFFDVAKITRDPSICSSIEDRIDIGSGLSGATTTQDMCLYEATRLAQLRPQNYFEAHPDSLCHALFILPLVLVGAVLAGRRQN